MVLNFFQFLKKLSSEPRENLTNVQFWRYHLASFFATRIGKIASPGDSFNWSIYHWHYQGELNSLAKKYTLALQKGDFRLVGKRLVQTSDKINRLHPNWHLLYETILQLRPRSVLEIGCGNGMHLHNLQVLSSNLDLYGLDRSYEQLKLLCQSYPNLKAKVEVVDITVKSLEKMFPFVDLTFTQAVLMHICSSRDAYLKALINLFNQTARYVVLVEKWGKHQFMADIRELYQNRAINWKTLFFYYRTYGKKGQPRLMICSKVPLKYPKLTKYEILTSSK